MKLTLLFWQVTLHLCLPGQSAVILLKRATKLSCCMRKAETATGAAGLSLCLSPLPLCQTTSAVAITTCRLSVGSSMQCTHMWKHTKFHAMGACENGYLSLTYKHWSLVYTLTQAHIATCKDACTYMHTNTHTHSLSLSLSLWFALGLSSGSLTFPASAVGCCLGTERVAMAAKA